MNSKLFPDLSRDDEYKIKNRGNLNPLFTFFYPYRTAKKILKTLINE